MGESLTQRIEERTGQKVDIDEWRASSKADHKNLLDIIEKLSKDVNRLSKKVDKLAKAKS